MINTNCFAYRKQKKERKEDCAALNKLYCAEGKCNFYKPRESLSKDDVFNISSSLCTE